jgi:hypothetical protein
LRVASLLVLNRHNGVILVIKLLEEVKKERTNFEQCFIQSNCRRWYGRPGYFIPVQSQFYSNKLYEKDLIRNIVHHSPYNGKAQTRFYV